MEIDYYAILDLKAGAPPEEVHRSLRRMLAMRHHPENQVRCRKLPLRWRGSTKRTPYSANSNT